MGRLLQFALWAFMPWTFAAFPSNKYVDDVTRGLSLNITASSNGQIKIDSMFQEKADTAWRPDKYPPGSRVRQGSNVNHIKTYKTRITDITVDYSEKLGNILNKGYLAVNKLRDTLETEARNFDFEKPVETNETILAEQIYYNAGYVNEYIDYNDEDDKYVMFKQQIPMRNDTCYGNGQLDITFDVSDVHVPFNVWNFDRRVVNGGNFSKKINNAFNFNYKNSKSVGLTWQYFAASDGYTRFHPGLKWKLFDEIQRPIDYDARFEPWYIDTINHPKEIVVVLDSSGSMKGFRQILAILTIRTLISTLGDNDYFNVIYFNDEPNFLHTCFNNTMARATEQNKEEFKALLQIMETKNVANFEKAILKAYETLVQFQNGTDAIPPVINQSQKPRTPACSRAIMILTDGALSDYEGAFVNGTKLFSPNSPDDIDDPSQPNEGEKIRIFTYLIGKDLKNSAPLKKMACNRRGYFSHIASPADVKENVMQYYHVMNRQLAREDNTKTEPRWSQVYNESKIGGKAVHGPIISATVAVYRRQSTSGVMPGVLSRDLLGVVGTDMPIYKLSDIFRPHELGPNGHAFLVTDNGFVSIHPEHKMMYNGKLRKNYRSTLITNVESVRPIDLKNIIKKLGEVKEKDVTARVQSARVTQPIDCNDCSNGVINCSNCSADCSTCKRFIANEVDYSFKKVKGSDFIIGVALPKMYRNSNITLVDNIMYSDAKTMNLDECKKSRSSKSWSSYQYRASYDDFNARTVICELYSELQSDPPRLQIAENWNYCNYKDKDLPNCRKFKQSDAIIDWFSTRSQFKALFK